MKFFQYNDNANLKMLDILHRYDLSDNSYVNKEIKKINSKLKKTAKLFNHFTIVLLCYTKYWFLNNQQGTFSEIPQDAVYYYLMHTCALILVKYDMYYNLICKYRSL